MVCYKLGTASQKKEYNFREKKLRLVGLWSPSLDILDKIESFRVPTKTLAECVVDDVIEFPIFNRPYSYSIAIYTLIF